MARQRANEEIGWLAQHEKQARIDRTRELAEWGGECVGNGRDTVVRSLTGPYWQLVGPRVQYNQPR